MAMGKSLALAVLISLSVGHNVSGQQCVTPYQSAARNAELTYVAQAMEATGLVSSFNNSNLRATIFLPKNVAFQKLLGQIGMTVDQALSSSSAFAPYLGQILEYHVVPNVALYAANFTDGQVVNTVIPDTFTVHKNPFTITPSGGPAATVTFTDFIACSAIEHVLDTVLLPKTVVSKFTASTSGGSVMPQVTAASGPDVLASSVAATPAVAVQPVPVQTVPTALVPAAALVDAAKTQAVTQADALKNKTVVVPVLAAAPAAQIPTPVVPVAASGVPLAPPPPPAAILLPKKEAVLPAVVKGIEDKVKGVLPVLAAAAPHPPMPVSGAPVATSGAPAAPLTPVVAAGPNPILDILKKPQQLLAQAAAAPITALQLPQIPIPLPQKPSIALPTVPAVPVYQFQLPDIKKEIQNIGDQLKNNLMGLVAQPPPSPLQEAVSGAPIVQPPPPPSSILLPAKMDIPVLDQLKSMVFPQAPPPPAMAAAPTAVSGAVPAMPETPAIASPPPPFSLLLPQPPQLPQLSDLLPKQDPLAAILAASPKSADSLKEEAAAAPLVIHLSDVQGVANLPSTVKGKTYSPPVDYSAASAQATASAKDGTVQAASGPDPSPVAGSIAVNDRAVYTVTSSCSTVPAVAESVPSMADFLAGLQMTGLDMALNVDTAMTTVFVPINAAFEAAAAQKNMTLNALFSDTNALTMLLKYHVIPGVSAIAENLTDGQTLQTSLPGQTIMVHKDASGVKLVSQSGVAASVIYPDVHACNGIMHIIDAVLMPAPPAAAAAAAGAVPATPAITPAAAAVMTTPAAAAMPPAGAAPTTPILPSPTPVVATVMTPMPAAASGGRH